MNQTINWDQELNTYTCDKNDLFKKYTEVSVDSELLKLAFFLDYCFINQNSKVNKGNCPEFNKWIDKKKEKYSCHSNNHDNKNFWNNDIENIFKDPFCEDTDDSNCCIRDTGYVCHELSLMKGAVVMSSEKSAIVSSKYSVIPDLPRYYIVTYVVGRIKLVYSICFPIIIAVILIFFII